MRPNYAAAPTMAAALHWLVNSDTPEEATVAPPHREAGTRCPPAVDLDAVPEEIRTAFLRAMAEAAMAPEPPRLPRGHALRGVWVDELSAHRAAGTPPEEAP